MQLVPAIVGLTLVKYGMRLTWIGRRENIAHRIRSPGIALAAHPTPSRLQACHGSCSRHCMAWHGGIKA